MYILKNMLTVDPICFSSFPSSDITRIPVEIFAYHTFCDEVRDRENTTMKCCIYAKI